MTAAEFSKRVLSTGEIERILAMPTEDFKEYLLAVFRMSMVRGDVITTTADVPKVFEVARKQVMAEITLVEKMLTGKADA